MNIKLNGDNKEFENEITINQMVDQLELNRELLAIMVNDKIVKKDQYEDTVLNEGDRVEIVSFVGGG